MLVDDMLAVSRHCQNYTACFQLRSNVAEMVLTCGDVSVRTCQHRRIVTVVARTLTYNRSCVMFVSYVYYFDSRGLAVRRLATIGLH